LHWRSVDKIGWLHGQAWLRRASQLSYRNTLAIFTYTKISKVCTTCRQQGSIRFVAPGLDGLANHPHNAVVDRFVGYSRWWRIHGYK
jgi:hypothetical protein